MGDVGAGGGGEEGRVEDALPIMSWPPIKDFPS